MRASSLLGERVNHGCRVGQVAGWHQRLALYDAGRQRRDSLRAPPPPQSTGFHLHPLILHAWAKTRGGADSRSSCGEREREKGAPRICEWRPRSLPPSPCTGPAWAGGLVWGDGRHGSRLGKVTPASCKNGLTRLKWS